MGYSGATAPEPEVTCLPADWWDPGWQALKSPAAAPVEPVTCAPGGAAEPGTGTAQPRTGTAQPRTGTAQPGAHPATPPPSWGQVLATTASLWTSRHVPRLRRSSRRLAPQRPAPQRLAPRRRLAQAAVGAGLVAVAVGTTGLAATVLSPASAAQAPARPSPIPVPSGPAVRPGGPSATALPPARPVWLSIPAIGVRTTLVDLGLNQNGTLQVPGSTAVAGWYTGSPRPGMTGSAVIAGHVDSRSGPGVFFWLRALRPGERVYVRRADGTMAVFAVTGVRLYAKDEFPTAAVYGPVPDAELRLITCGGIFDRSLGHYLSNVVVFARLAG